MDFLPLPEGVESHWPVPDLGGPDFDNKGFEGFDERQGWNLAALLKGDVKGSRKDWPEVASALLKEGRITTTSTEDEVNLATVGAFFQTWFFFGTWQEVLARPILRSEGSVESGTLLGHSRNTMHLTASNLYKEFLRRQRELQQDLKRATQIVLHSRRAQSILQDLDRACDEHSLEFFPMTVHLALCALLQDLEANISVWHADSIPKTSVAWLRCDPLEQKMVFEDGWCPVMVHRVSSAIGIGGQYYMNLLSDFQDNLAHEGCNKASACVASNIDEENYVVRHQPDYCLCQPTGCEHGTADCACHHLEMPDLSSLGVFDNGGFPLVQIENDKIKVVPYRPGVRFAAISHVWSDGMGNPKSNSLPICQLRFIQDRVTGLTGNEDTLFWIDALCVPMQKSLKKLAILRMATTYGAASHVLVFSGELLRRKLPPSPEEAFMSILCSKWTGRLWTIQEAALAKNIFFVFADKTIPYLFVEQVLNTVNANTDNTSGLIRTRAAIAVMASTMGDILIKRETFPIIGFMEALRYRSTSRPLDVTICASSLLGTDLKAVLDAPHDRKMQTFWSCQSKVPVSVLWSYGPRLNVDGFRWAPSDFFHPETDFTVSDPEHPAGRPGASGLYFQGVLAIMLDKVPFPTNELSYSRSNLPSSSQSYVFHAPRRFEEPVDMKSSWTGSWTLGVLAVLLPSKGSQNEEEEQPVLYARHISKVLIQTEASWLERNATLATVADASDTSASDRETPGCVNVEAFFELDRTQAWCVG
ncbi:hypothetical protein H2200_008985 [Cladophialophora chaetospira]|uniref:Heterokaryon incompatibility domain-containing protein n=1 Tax=Cladophialophora chaetospira TaxID=386627 RepID=A0AA38X520_9EURO|nr:hypothetical protein H2200_008985 [Cladophialophora chaetospira]